MDFVEFVKKNILVISALGITVLLTAVFAYVMNMTFQELTKWRDEVTTMRQKEKAFSGADFALTRENLKTANSNADVAVAQYGKLLTDLASQFFTPDYTTERRLDPIKMKDQITQKCELWSTQLERRKVTTNITGFTFQSYIKEGTLPNPNDIPMIRKNLDIVEELVSKIAAADMQGFDSLKRKKNNDLYPDEKDLYSYLRFHLNLTGNVVQIQRFLNSLDTSRYCFIVQRVDILGTDLTKQLAYPTAANANTPAGNPTPEMMDPAGMDMMPPGALPPGAALPPMGNKPMGSAAATSRKPTPAVKKKILTKDERVAFTELNTLKVALIIDYVEFQRPPETAGE